MHLTRRLTPPAPLTLVTVVHVPELQGYWSGSLEVLKLCLTSLRESVAIVQFQNILYYND